MRHKITHPGDIVLGFINTITGCGILCVGGRILCNPGDQSRPHSDCHKMPPGVLFCLGVILVRLWFLVLYTVEGKQTQKASTQALTALDV